MPRIAMISTRSAFISALTAAAFTTTAADARSGSRKSDNLVPVGEAIDCLPLSNIRSTHIIDDKTIDFEVGVNTLYRNTLPYECHGLKSEERFAYKTSMSQLCAIDTISVLRDFGGTFSMGPSCGLGKFQKMEKAGK